jgi:hypothetical protein
MADLRSFNAGQGTSNRHYDLVPDGNYVAVITKSSDRRTKAGTGIYLLLTFLIIEGPFANRLVWAWLNLQNRSKAADFYAQQEFDAICRALGMQRPNDSTELHGWPLVIQVGHKRRTDNGELTNVICGYSSQPPQPAAPVAPANAITSFRVPTNSAPTAPSNTPSPWPQQWPQS